MKLYTEVNVPVRVEKRHLKNSCDVCGKESVTTGYEGESEWIGGYDIDKTCISRKTGSSYPEGGMGDIEFYHICPDCFENKLKPFMESIGAKINKEDWDR